MEEYIARYGMDFNPFIKESHDIVIQTDDFKEMSIRLNYLLKNRGFGVITGGPGRGKTTAVRNYIKNVSQSLYKITYTSLSTLTVNEFYRHLATELGIEAAHRKNENFINIQAEINRCVLEKKLTPVIIIDEANYINNAILNDLKMLFNFEMDSRDRAIVLLVGLPQLNNTLRLAANEPLKQRITMNYNFESLSKEQSIAYINAKISGANGPASIFNPNALEAIANASNGIPRIINNICNGSLIIAATKKKDYVDEDVVMDAVNDIEIS